VRVNVHVHDMPEYGLISVDWKDAKMENNMRQLRLKRRRIWFVPSKRTTERLLDAIRQLLDADPEVDQAAKNAVLDAIKSAKGWWLDLDNNTIELEVSGR